MLKLLAKPRWQRVGHEDRVVRFDRRRQKLAELGELFVDERDEFKMLVIGVHDGFD